MSTVAERVARGAELLDETLPGWDERIDLAWLELSSCYRCVIGQLFTGGLFPGGAYTPYGFGISVLGIDRGSHYGFDGHDADELNGEWRRVITKRRARVLAGATT